MTNQTADPDALRKAYGPLLDESVVYALASDYDLSNDQQRDDFIETLKVVNDGAAINEAANDEDIVDPSVSGHESRTTPDSNPVNKAVTSATSEFSNLHLTTSGESLGEDLEHLSDIEKRKYLKDLFPGTDIAQIVKALGEAGSLRAAIDDLLNIAFISTYAYDDRSEDGHAVSKGIDAFAADLRPERGRKHRQRKNRTTDSSRTNSANSYRAHTPQRSNAWSNEDIEFICSRTTLSTQSVSSIYHSKGTNLAHTIKELADREKKSLPTFAQADDMVQFQVTALQEDFPTVSPSTIQALLHLARNIPSAAGELLEAMLTKPTDDHLPPGRLDGVVQYAPVKIDESDHDWTTISSSTSTNINHFTLSHAASASQAFSSASQAARRAKSDKLMGGAAAYYASLGHEHIRYAKAETSAAADALVASQSTRTRVDLHGVSVADAVRIANARTAAWWDALGDTKLGNVNGGGGYGAKSTGFQIVTGLGTHSRNNAPRIGPAVAKSLVREGWKVEVGRGEMFVLGRARR